MNKVSFVKMNGAGNDFIVFDKDAFPFLVFNDDVVKKLCSRQYGIGADGVISVARDEKHDFKMEYFNADGSTGSLCGNGARCALKFAAESGRLNSGKGVFLSNGIQYSGEVISDRIVKFNLNDPGKIKLNFKVKAAHQLITASFVDTGSPHVVIHSGDILIDPEQPRIFFGDINEVPVVEVGREIRYLKEFQPGGTNVNFINISNNLVHIRTYERGVENETLACGTGAAAAAIVSHFNYRLNPPVTLVTRGGDELKVDFKVIDGAVSEVSLTGPAEITFRGEFIINNFF